MCVRECKEHRETKFPSSYSSNMIQKRLMCVCTVVYVYASHRAQKCRRLTSHACFAHTFYFFVMAAVWQ